jgi:L-cysteine desulfidase
MWGLVCFPLGCVAYISAGLVVAALDAKAKADMDNQVAALVNASTTQNALQVGLPTICGV